MREITLRPYQIDAVEALREGVRSGHRSQVLHAPNGAGTMEAAAWTGKDGDEHKGWRRTAPEVLTVYLARKRDEAGNAA